MYRAPLFVPSADRTNACKRILHEVSFNVTSSIYWLPNFFRRRTYER